MCSLEVSLHHGRIIYLIIRRRSSTGMNSPATSTEVDGDKDLLEFSRRLIIIYNQFNVYRITVDGLRIRSLNCKPEKYPG